MFDLNGSRDGSDGSVLLCGGPLVVDWPCSDTHCPPAAAPKGSGPWAESCPSQRVVGDGSPGSAPQCSSIIPLLCVDQPGLWGLASWRISK